MTETAKWRHVSTVTEEMYKTGIKWVWETPSGGSDSASPKQTLYCGFVKCGNNAKGQQVYGPILPSPVPPPKIRRFTAEHSKHGSVSGAMFPTLKDCYWSKAVIAYWDGESASWNWASESDLSNVVWLDKE